MNAEAQPMRGAPVPARPGAILLVRHGEPALSRRVRLDSEGYRRWWAMYEEGGLLTGQSPPFPLVELAKSAHVVSSTRRRSIETAQALAFGTFQSEDIFIEAPLPPPRLPGFLKFSPRTWGVIARCAWWLGHHQGEESRRQAQARARAAALRLSELAGQGRDVMVLAHGFFNAMVAGELRRLGWRCVRDEGFSYWSQRRFERI